MATGNSMMQLEQGAGWTRGLRNLLRGELGEWFGTRTWLRQVLIWAAIINGILLSAALQTPKSEAQVGLMIFNIFMGMAPPVGVAIMMMDAIVGEKRTGTAAWILSKPVSRAAFVLSKLIGNGLGVLVCILLAQGLIGFGILRLVSHLSLSPLHFAAGMGAHLLNLAFYLTLGTMLGAVFQKPAPVVGIPIAFNFAQQYLPSLLPFLRDKLPWNLGMPFGNGASPSVAQAWMQGLEPLTVTPAILALVASVVFVVVALLAFQRQEL
jgi:ABC-2 type transport system permease protein